MSVEWLTYKGKQILSVDYRPCKTDEERLAIFDRYVAEVKKGQPPILVYQDFTGNFASEALMSKAKDASEWTNKLIGKVAIVGITGIKKILLNSFKFFSKIKIEALDTKEEALEFLIK